LTRCSSYCASYVYAKNSRHKRRAILSAISEILSEFRRYFREEKRLLFDLAVSPQFRSRLVRLRKYGTTASYYNAPHRRLCAKFYCTTDVPDAYARILWHQLCSIYIGCHRSTTLKVASTTHQLIFNLYNVNIVNRTVNLNRHLFRKDK
jgi:hypothetical protein